MNLRMGMNLMFEQVCHKTFGLGVIISQSDKVVTVHFDDPVEEKRVLYPSAFTQYLRLCNDQCQSQLEAEIAEHQAQQEAAAQQQQAILERQETLRRQRLAEEQARSAQHTVGKKRLAAKGQHKAKQK